MPRKIKTPPRICQVCGEEEETAKMTIFNNGFVCPECLESGEFEKFKQRLQPEVIINALKKLQE